MHSQEKRSYATQRGFAPMRDFALLDNTKAFAFAGRKDIRRASSVSPSRPRPTSSATRA